MFCFRPIAHFVRLLQQHYSRVSTWCVSLPISLHTFNIWKPTNRLPLDSFGMFWNCNVYMLIESIYTDDFHRDKKKSEQTNIGDWQRQWSILAQIRWHSQREFVLGQSKHRTTLWCMLKFRVVISVLRGRWTLTEKIDVWTPSMVHIQMSAATYHSASQRHRAGEILCWEKSIFTA